MNTASQLLTNLSPINLSYVATLRGVTPRQPGTEFVYAQMDCHDFESLLCLAASNPEGKFYGVMPNDGLATKAQNMADKRGVENAVFVVGDLSQIQADYIVLDETAQNLSDEARASIFAWAEKALRPGGLFACHYRAYENADEILRFLVNEFAPEMNESQAKTMLTELRDLGPFYFAERSIARAALDKAMATGKPEDFFSTCTAGAPARARSFETVAALSARGFAYAGDAHVGDNYLELSTPTSAHPVLIACRENPLYEVIKDFAMQRLERTDIWCRLPVEQTDNVVSLYGGFTYGITAPAAHMPKDVVSRSGKLIDLSKGVMAKLIALMNLLPVGIGDFLAHPSSAGFNAAQAIEGLQVLIALGIARPMRSSYKGQKDANISSPKWANAFNRYLDETTIASQSVWLASPVVGGGIEVPMRDALVMQAVGRVGLTNSPSALLTELKRVTSDPALAAQIKLMEATPTAAEEMVRDVMQDAVVRWYAYGILAA